jgi:hypothetical protein
LETATRETVNGFSAGQQDEESHPSPYSPDFTPSDFSLFANMKWKLTECSIDNADDFLRVIHGISDGFDRPMLISVFEV